MQVEQLFQSSVLVPLVCFWIFFLELHVILFPKKKKIVVELLSVSHLLVFLSSPVKPDERIWRRPVMDLATRWAQKSFSNLVLRGVFMLWDRSAKSYLFPVLFQSSNNLLRCVDLFWVSRSGLWSEVYMAHRYQKGCTGLQWSGICDCT